MVAQALQAFNSPLTKEKDYWSERARVIMNITRDEADILRQFTKKDSIEEYVALSDEKKMKNGQLQIFNDSDIATIERIYGLKPERVKYFNSNIEQINTELKLLPPYIFEMRKRDNERTSVELNGYTVELLTDTLLESVLSMADQNFKNLQHLALIDC